GHRPRRHGQHAHRGPVVIGLGLRLAVSGGREAATRLVVLAVAVGLGVGLLLTAVAATNAVTTWNNRHAWFWTGTSSLPASPSAAPPPLRGGGPPPAGGPPPRRPLRRPADQPLRRGRHRRLVTGATGHPP